MSWLPKKKVIVPLSFSDDGFEPIEAALSVVDDPSHVHIIHVLPKLSSMEPGAMWGDVTDEKRMERTGKEIEKKLAFEERYSKCVIVTKVGSPASTIAKYAKKEEADLIVLSSRGHSRAHNFFLGSTADSVFHEVHCPVLVLKK